MPTAVPLSVVHDFDGAHRRLTRPWLWVVRSIWVVVMTLMALLILAAVANAFRWSAQRTASIGADFVWNERNEWTLKPVPDGAAAEAGIQAGDVLLAVDGLTVTGDTPDLTLANLFGGAPGTEVTLSVRGADGNVTSHTIRMRKDPGPNLNERLAPHGFWVVYYPLLEGLLLLTYLATAALLFWRRSNDWLVAWISLALVLVTLDLSYTWWQLQVTYPQLAPVVDRLATLGATLALPVLYVLPDGRFVPRWSVLLAGVWATWIVVQNVFPDSAITLSSLPHSAVLAVYLGWYGTGILAQVYRYRRVSMPLQRQQTRWIILGLAAAILARYGWDLALTLAPALNKPGWPNVLMWLIGRPIYVAALLLLPVSLGIAMRRYRLWDIGPAIKASSPTAH